MRRVGRILDGVYLIGAWGAGALLITLCAIVVWSVLARIIGVFAGGANDVAGYVMATSSFLALAYTFRNHGHIRVAILIERMAGATRRGLETLCLAIISALAVYLAYFMTRLAMESWKYGERSEGADAIELWIPQTPLAFGAGLFAVATIHTLIEAVFDYSKFNAAHRAGEGPSEI